jgi:hypothetical protein
MKGSRRSWYGGCYTIAEEAEALACWEGIKLADHWSKNIAVHVESGCANIVEKVENGEGDCSVISAVLMDIKREMVQRGSCKVKKIWREENQIAHNLAKFAFKNS